MDWLTYSFTLEGHRNSRLKGETPVFITIILSGLLAMVKVHPCTGTEALYSP